MYKHDVGGAIVNSFRGMETLIARVGDLKTAPARSAARSSRSESAVPSRRIASDRAVEQPLARAEDDRTTVYLDLVEEAGVEQVRGDAARRRPPRGPYPPPSSISA
jgi:hypothetical protein